MKSKRLLTLLACSTLLTIIAPPAFAQLAGTDTKPGDPCTAAEEGYVRRNASVARDASEITLMCNGSTWQSATGSGTLPALASSKIWVGNGSNAATAVSVSGDATLSNAGTLTIANNAIGSSEITDGSIANADLAGSIALSKLSVTGTANSSVFLRGDGTWAAPPSGADNLGNHTATQNIVVGSNWISSSGGNSGLRIDANLGASLTEASVGNQTALLLGNGATNSRAILRASPAGDNTQNITIHGAGSSDTGAFIIANGLGSAVSGEGNGGMLFETARTSLTGSHLFRTQGATRLTIGAGGDITATGAIAAASFSGSGASLTALNATNLSSGTVPAARLPAYTGDVTKAAGGTALTIASGAVDLTHLSATGTKSASTFLRGDNTWAAPSGGGGADPGTLCGLAIYQETGGGAANCGSNFYGSLITCKGASVVTSCPAGYTLRSIGIGGDYYVNTDTWYNNTCVRTCSKN